MVVGVAVAVSLSLSLGCGFGFGGGVGGGFWSAVVMVVVDAYGSSIGFTVGVCVVNF